MTWKTWLFALALAVTLGAACSKSSKGISVNAKTGNGAAPTSNSLDLGNGVVLQRVRFSVAKVEVEGAAAAPTPTPSPTPTPTPMPGMGSGMDMKDGGDEGGGGDGGGDDDGGEAEGEDGGHGMESGPFLVDLADSDLTGGIHFQFKVDVPNGTFDEVSFRIGLVSADAAAAAPVEAQRAGLAELAGKHASVVVNGTFKGAAFEFAAAISAKQENEGKVVVDSSGAALTLNVDPSGWFTGADPTTALDPSDPANAATIARNIRASIHVENDDDHHDG